MNKIREEEKNKQQQLVAERVTEFLCQTKKRIE